MMDYEDRIETPIAHRVSRLAFHWKYVEQKPNKISCICCPKIAVGVYYCPFGTNESVNKIQPLCEHHQKDFGMFKNELYLLEEF